MANVTKKNIKNLPTYGGLPSGNLSVLSFSFETNASGVWVDSDLATAVQVADVCRLGIIPAGTKIGFEYGANINDAFVASTTMKVGFAYVDGVDVAAVPQDDDYFCAATTMATAARLKMTNTAVRPVTLPKDAFLTLVNGGAAHSAVGIVDFDIFCVLGGQP
jgi:hypothetical protein